MRLLCCWRCLALHLRLHLRLHHLHHLERLRLHLGLHLLCLLRLRLHCCGRPRLRVGRGLRGCCGCCSLRGCGSCGGLRLCGCAPLCLRLGHAR